MAAVPDVSPFCPASRILNASLAMHFERQLAGPANLTPPGPQKFAPTVPEPSRYAPSVPEPPSVEPGSLSQSELSFEDRIKSNFEDRIKSELCRPQCEPIPETVPHIFIPNLARSDEEEEIEVE